MMTVEVAYALPDEQKIVSLQVDEVCTVYEAVIQSRIVEHFPDIDPDSNPMGVFGKSVKDPKSVQLHPGDRVEIYRPLLADPKEIRARKAAEKAKAEKAQS
ncbi:RnfH family protein [Nitrincola sp. MINF-07-Sa-05]|uniref:RnfH family protein n=1 Tax=Nitrincola salilacus TaxID=3400273 RepID=UPI003917FA84